MYQYYIVEIKKFSNGEYEHQVYYTWDEDVTKARLKAESKYYEILSAAAVSEYTTHSAIIFSSKGEPLMHKCYSQTEETEE